MINSVLHETIIRDIIDLSKDVGDNVEDVKKAMSSAYSKNSFTSIAKASSDLVLVFPFMCDSTVSMESASMVSKAIERQCVSMLRLLFSALQLSKDKSPDAISFLSQFHKNISSSDMGDITVDDFLTYADKFAESADAKVINPDALKVVKEQLERMKYDVELAESISENSLMDYSVVERNSTIHVLEAGRNGGKDKDKKDKKPKMNPDKNYNKGGSSSYGSKFNPEDGANLAKYMKDRTDAERNRILDADWKKANELMPTMMVVDYIGTAENGDPIPMSFVCGVKCRLVPVDPMDIADRILVKHSDRNVLTSFIRATTGEISFVKDFLLAIDTAKIDALSNSRKGSSNKMWKVLERRALKSKYRRAFSHPNDAACITTLGISSDLAEYIKKENGIDVSNPRTMRGIMEGYNLMGAVIINEATEVCQFLWDTGEGFYESISFTNLEREASGGEYKKALNLMQKMYR